MEKGTERANLVKVFGNWAEHARDHERPDFILATPSGETVGVEVTSIYSSDSDAKVKRLDGYSEALLTRTRGVHRADQRDLKVDDITLLHPDGRRYHSEDAFTGRVHATTVRVHRRQAVEGCRLSAGVRAR